jgi:hypothetical protein
MDDEAIAIERPRGKGAQLSGPLSKLFKQVRQFADLRSFLVVDKIENTNLHEFRVLHFVFCILSLSIVRVDRRQNRLEICVLNFCLVFLTNDRTRNRDKIHSHGRVLSRDKIQNRTRNSSSFVFLYFADH